MTRVAGRLWVAMSLAACLGCVGDNTGTTCVDACTQPTPSACEGEGSLRVFTAPGTCAQGRCVYASHLEACAAGCASGACVNDPCQGITCATPPAAACASPTTLRSYNASGTCTAGACAYAATDSSCAQGCSDGGCINDPCQGVSCTTPPANTCADAVTLRTYSSLGSCSGGACTYAPITSPCAFGCASGACVNDPCQGVTCATPPAATCASATTLRTFSSPGTCSAGACTYAPTDTTCPSGCANGACLNNPCHGVTCTTAPATSCVDASTLRTFTSPGTCGGGSCTYAAADSTCQYRCANGACLNDPCQGVTCTTPPATSCVDASTLRTFTSPGTCSGGACSYGAVDTACANACSNGACTGVDYEWANWLVPPASPPASNYQASGGVVTDSVTALQWQQTLSTATYTWADAKTYCTGLSLAGTGWRLPTLVELESIVNYGTYNPAIVAAAFPNTPGTGVFWAASTLASTPGYAWALDFNFGASTYASAPSLQRVRCVRSPGLGPGLPGQVGAPPGRYALSAETVLDTKTALTWQRNVAATTTFTQASGATYCQGLSVGGLTGWRLPTVKELQSLVDTRTYRPALDSGAFPGSPMSAYWSSSPNLYFGFSYAWYVDFYTGSAFGTLKTNSYTVRCVR